MSDLAVPQTARIPPRPGWQHRRAARWFWKAADHLRILVGVAEWRSHDSPEVLSREGVVRKGVTRVAFRS